MNTNKTFDHEAARQYAEGILKRGSAYSNPGRNLARCYLAHATFDEAANTALRSRVAELDAQLRDVDQLRAEVAHYRGVANDLARVLVTLTDDRDA